MGNACPTKIGGPCVRTIICSTPFVVLVGVGASFALGVTLAELCISELLIVFSGQALVLLFWMCCRRPRARVTWVYCFICSVLLVRETILMMTGGVPCGFAMAGEGNCKESRCAEYSKILWAATSCKRRECGEYYQLRAPREPPAASADGTRSGHFMQVHWVPPEEIRTTWLLSAHCCVWAAVLLSFIQLLRWHSAMKQPYAAASRSPGGKLSAENSGFMAGNRERADIEQPISLILAVPMTYGLCAVHALRRLTINQDDAWSAEAMMDAAELYSSIALYAFQRLLVQYIDQGMLPGLHLGDSIVVDVSAVEGEALELRHSLQRLVAAGIKQYIFLAFTCNSIEVCAKVWNWWTPSSCAPALARVASMWFPRHRINITIDEEWAESQQLFNQGSAACADLWNVTSLLMVVADFFTCSIALFAIWTYERTFAQFFGPMKPFWKFLGVKGLLSVGWLQAIALLCIGFLAESGSWSDENFRTFVNYHLVCVEALLLACLNIFAYPPTPPPWTSIGEGDDLRTLGMNGLEELDPDSSPHLMVTPDVVGKGL